MSVSFPIPTASRPDEIMAVGSNMEAATGALIRFRDEMVATFDRHVVELQQIHRALACAPPPMTVIEDTAPRPPAASPATASRASLFDDAPRFAALAPPAPVIQAPRPPAAPPTAHAPATAALIVEEKACVAFSEPTLDPGLERATLDELNAALASAFATISSRSAQHVAR